MYFIVQSLGVGGGGLGLGPGLPLVADDYM